MKPRRNETYLEQCRECRYPACGRLIDRSDGSVWTARDTGFRVAQPQEVAGAATAGRTAR